MHVLIVSSDIPPYAFGGTGSFVYELTNQLKKEDVELTLISGSDKQSTLNIEGNTTTIRVHVLQAPPRDVWFQMGSYKVVEDYAKKADVIHLQSFNSSLIIDRLLKSTQKPILLTVHGIHWSIFKETLRMNIKYITLDDFLTNIFTLPMYAAFNVSEILRTNCIVAVANHVLEDLKHLYGRTIMQKGIVIPIGLDLHLLKPRNNIYQNEREKRIAFVGRLYWLKGIIHLLEAVRVLSRRQSDMNITLHIYGKGPLEHKIKQYIKKNDLESHINLYGKIPRDKLLRHLANDDLLVLPSYYEACPVSLLEAMALGKPVITSDKPWSREFVEDGVNGFRVDVNNPIHFADVIENAVSDRDFLEKLGRNARNTVMMKYAISDIARQYLHVYNRLIK